MATTTNYSWTTPDDTDLVKDGAAAIRTLGTAIDTTVFTNAGAAVAKATVDAKGDLIAGTADNTIARLAVGANDTVLTADSSTATGLKWAAPAGGANWTLVNAGGTALTGAGVITVSGISNADKIMVLFQGGVSTAGASDVVGVRLNTDSGSNYRWYGQEMNFPTTYTKNISSSLDGATQNRIQVFVLSGTAASTGNGYVLITGANSSGVKMYQSVGASNNGSSDNATSYNYGGFYNSASVITSISAVCFGGNFDGGDLFVYTSA